MKKLIAAALASSLFLFSLNAQTPPDATVDENGNLILYPGTPDEQVIAPPSGTVDSSGTLTVGGTAYPAPTATVLENGDLDLGGGTVLQLPTLPEGGAFIVNWFGDKLYDFPSSPGPDENQFYWSYNWKSMLHFAAGNWFWFQEFDSFFYIVPDNASITTGFWAYTGDLLPGQSTGVWMWFYMDPDSFNDLRDTDFDGTLDLVNGEDTSGLTVDGYVWIASAFSYNYDDLNGNAGTDSAGEGIFFFSEYANGNWMLRLSEGLNAPAGEYWSKVSDPQ